MNEFKERTIMELISDTDFVSSFSKEEIDVASILLELPRLIAESESRRLRPLLTWGARKKRSSCDSASLPPPPTSSSQQPAVQPVSVPVAADGAKNEVDRTSPITPLSFPPSECEDKSKKPKKKVSLKRRQELLELVEKLTHRRELFLREVETVKKYCEEQKALNLLLKRKEEEVISAKKSVENGETLSFFPAGASGNDKVVLSGGIPDLNLIPAEAMSDMNRALAAAARRRRIEICRSKLRHMHR
ncbi:uncharacterized protein LOC110818204 isoform X2 [Carica papaya]|uniref:uncharacterized protein LOC110818204 isoform X2 n=1 Tax=Carica papaya TaxID=3649 RepID=UPI000B8C8227|nr:uncharacterized protein LOC110818204 isoform X2 [Carica papaya]